MLNRWDSDGDGDVDYEGKFIKLSNDIKYYNLNLNSFFFYRIYNINGH
jgi:hypothetical protein